MERPEIGGGVVQGVLLELVLCFKGQVDGLGTAGVGSSPSGEALGPEPAGPATTGIRPDDALKNFGKKGSLRSEIVQSAHLFFNSLGPAVLWEWVCGLVHRTLSGAVEGEEPSLPSSSSSLRVDRCKSPSALTKGLSVSVVTGLLKFLLKALPLVCMDVAGVGSLLIIVCMYTLCLSNAHTHMHTHTHIYTCAHTHTCTYMY